jgi:hypothetical protein
VNRALALARAYGVAVCFADLGDWGAADLVSEYDPRVPEIRLNLRVARRLEARELRRFVALAIGHELYHHRERVGHERVVSGNEARERAASEFARRLAGGND